MSDQLKHMFACLQVLPVPNPINKKNTHTHTPTHIHMSAMDDFAAASQSTE